MKRRNGRKAALVSASILLSVMTVGLSACSGSSDDSSDASKKIKFVAAEYSPKTGPYWRELAKDYKKKTGIEVDVQTIPWADIHQQVSTMVQTGQLPDVLNLDTYSAYAEEGLLWPAKDVESAKLAANIPKNLTDSGLYKDAPYGIPLLASTSVLFYNTDLFKQAGITAPPASTDELAADATKIAALPGGNAGFAVSLGPEAAQIDFGMLMYNFGGDYVKDGKWALNSAKNVDALTYLNSLAKSGATEVNPGRTNRTSSGTWQLFASGKAGMVIGQSALVTQLKDHPKVHYAVAPFPAAAGAEPHALAVADYLMAFKKKGNKKAVSSFLDFVYDQKNYHTFITNEGLLPATTDEQQAESSDKSVAAYLEALKSAVFAPIGQKGWDDVVGALKNNVGLALQGEDPKKILDQLQATAVSKS